MARDVGAKQIVFASCAPPIRHANVYGIDMPARTELVAHDRTEDDIARAIGADLVIFQKLDDLIWSVRQFNTDIPQFDCSVFTGEYVTGGVDETYLSGLEQLRADNSQGTALGIVAQKAGGGTNGVKHSEGEQMGCSGPLNGADDNVGLYNWRKQ